MDHFWPEKSQTFVRASADAVPSSTGQCSWGTVCPAGDKSRGSAESSGTKLIRRHPQSVIDLSIDWNLGSVDLPPEAHARGGENEDEGDDHQKLWE